MHMTHTHTHTHTWCMNTNDTMTVWFSQIGDHTLGHQHPTGQGQNRASSVKKKIEHVVGYSCRATYTPMVYEKACDNDFGGLGATRARLAPAVLHRSESESSSIRGKLWSCYYEKPPLLSLCLCWQIHDNDVYQGV